MTAIEYDSLPGIARLRMAAMAFENTRESFVHNEDGDEPWTAAQLLAIHRAWVLCRWDVAPDEWSERQIQEALAGVLPTFDNKGNPVYA